MKISSNESGQAGHATARPNEHILPKERPRRKELRSHLTKAQLTPLEQGILQAEHALESIPDVRADVVESLKKRIAEGTYKVTGEEIADMMVRRRLADRIR